MAYNTSTTLLTATKPLQQSMLTYSTSTMTTQTRSATATPDPDYFGNTNYLDSSGVGVGGTSNNSFNFDVSHVSSDRYPNYTLRASIKSPLMGNFTGTFTPTIHDSGGVAGLTSGPIPLNLTRNFQWGVLTNFTTIISGSTNTAGLIFDQNEYYRYVAVNNLAIGSSIGTLGQWNTLQSLSQDAGLYNEVKFEDAGGSNLWQVVTVNSISTTMTTGRSKNTYYDITGAGIRFDTISSNGGSNSGSITVTFRNKTNNSINASYTLNFTVNRVD